MIEFAPMPLVDDFLLKYNVGQALLLLFVLSVLGALPLGSRKVLSLNAILFGVIFVLTPASLAPLQYKFLGLGLLVVSPLLYVTAKR